MICQSKPMVFGRPLQNGGKVLFDRIVGRDERARRSEKQQQQGHKEAENG